MRGTRDRREGKEGGGWKKDRGGELEDPGRKRRSVDHRVSPARKRESIIAREFDFGSHERESQYRYYSVAVILGYNTMVYGHTEIYGVIRVIVGT